MTLLQTERLPSPTAIDDVVVTDVATRSLGVRLSELSSGYEKMWWKTAHQALRSAKESGWNSHPFVWASTPSAYQVAHVQPSDFQMLQVTFPTGTPFGELISKPGLYAIAVIDRNSARFLSVKFLHR